MFRRTAVVLVLALAVPFGVLAHGGMAHVMGTVMAFDGTHVTVKTLDGKAVTILLSKGTKYLKDKTAVTAADLKIGERVVVDVTGEGQKATAKEIRLGSQGIGEGHAGMQHNPPKP